MDVGCAVGLCPEACRDEAGYVGHGWPGRTVSCTPTGHSVPDAPGLHCPLRPVGVSRGASGTVSGPFVCCVLGDPHAAS